tara:strand:- start:4399 stop:5352 length:954 start_codon:yes stop_codon:yes gene_type:complete
MRKPLILHVDENHPLLIKGLKDMGFENVIEYNTPLEKLIPNLKLYKGLVIRSRFPIDKKFLDLATNLKFIARVGAGLENIDISYAEHKNISLIAAPEGNRNAVGEHALGMLLGIMNKLRMGHQNISKGLWLRELHRGYEIEGKTVGIIGYGNTGKSFAKKLTGFNDVEILCYDIKPNLGDKIAKQVSINELQSKAQIISLHVPETDQTIGMIDKNFISKMKHPFWLINTARGKAVVTKDLVDAIKSKKIIGAGLDVLDYESSSFNSVFNSDKELNSLKFLIEADQVILSPHVGGWTVESHQKLAKTILNKILNLRII